MPTIKQAQRPKVTTRSQPARNSKLSEEQESKFMRKVKKLAHWPDVSAAEWLALCLKDYGVELKTDDEAYKKMDRAGRNARYQRSLKQDSAQ